MRVAYASSNQCERNEGRSSHQANGTRTDSQHRLAPCRTAAGTQGRSGETGSSSMISPPCRFTMSTASSFSCVKACGPPTPFMHTLWCQILKPSPDTSLSTSRRRFRSSRQSSQKAQKLQRTKVTAPTTKTIFRPLLSADHVAMLDQPSPINPNPIMVMTLHLPQTLPSMPLFLHKR